MGNQNLKNKIITQAKVDSSWLDNAKNRQSNKSWLDISFKIALKILRYIRNHKISQKDLAAKLNWSPQYLSKVLKGKENLTLETICKIQDIIGLTLVQVPIYSDKIEIQYGPSEIIFTISVKEIKDKMSFIHNKEAYSKDREEIAKPINEKYLEAA